MRSHTIRLFSTLCGLLLLAACGTMAGRGTPTPALSDREAVFMRDAAAGGVSEIRLGQFAMQNAASPEVKRYGHQMVENHTVIDQQLRNIADRRNVTVPAQPDPESGDTAKRLSRLTGPEFDRQFLDQMVKDHERTVSRFRNQAAQGQDPEVRAFAERSLPVLQQHLDQARALRRNAGG